MGRSRTGRKQGQWESYHDNGQLEQRGTYENDLANGLLEWFHDNGQLRSEGKLQGQ